MGKRNKLVLFQPYDFPNDDLQVVLPGARITYPGYPWD